MKGPLVALWLLIVVFAVTISADEASDPEGLLDPGADTNTEPLYSVYVGRWTECISIDDQEHTIKTADRFSIKQATDSLVYTPKLGLQRRSVQCRAKDGQFVEAMYCGYSIAEVGTRRVCVVREDCLLAEWLPWRPRADGALVRTRRVKKLPQGGGKECELVEEVKPVVLEPSAHWSPGPWGVCEVAIEQSTLNNQSDNEDDDADDRDAIYSDDDPPDDDLECNLEEIENNDISPNCGGGVQRRETTCVRADGRALPANQCAHTPLPILVQPCEVPCPRDCEVGEWNEWSPCQPTEGCPLYPVQQLTSTGYSVRSRRVVSAASGGGAPCPPLEEKRTCPNPRCASWKSLPWGPCVLDQPHTVCGPGRRSRELQCVGNDGKEAERAWCSSSRAPLRWERCRIACAGDCVVSAWGPWKSCPAPCAPPAHPPPKRMRERHVLAHPSPDGWPCPAEDQLVQHETCNTHACATYSWLATPWGPCQKSLQDYSPPNNYTELQDSDPFDATEDEEPCVEEGEMARDVMCVQNNADVVREALCSPLHRPSSRRACTVRCRRGCRLGAWMPWSPCPNTCEPGNQVRIRNVIGGPNCGASRESRPCPVARSCRARAAAWAATAWQPCHLPPGEKCGNGHTIRSIWCGSESHRVEAAQCASLPMPDTSAPCQVSCTKPLAVANCDTICKDPVKYLDAPEPDMPSCVCKNVTLDILPSDSDCILPPGMECGEGRILRAARCMVGGRDVAMDLCKKFHPLSGPLRVRSPSADGYSYDEEFSGLLRGPCSLRCSRDCVAGPWSSWGPCAAEPGSKAAFRFRTREVLEEGSAGGRECGATLQRATCVLAEPRWHTGEWSLCTPQRSLCGHAITNRTVDCVDGSGRKLDASVCESSSAGPSPAHEAPCRAPCPRDCVVSSWSDWSPCEQTKWGGRRDRTRAVLRAAGQGGAACPALVAAEPCSPHRYAWHLAPWDDCQPLGGSPCGEGMKTRSVRCLRSDGIFVNDTLCPNSTAAESRESWCYVPCGADCALGPWQPWDLSACDCTPHKHITRFRTRLSSAVWPGRACAKSEQRAPCPREPCLRAVQRANPTCTILKLDGTEASGACGWGVRESKAVCTVERNEGAERGEEDVAMAAWRCLSPAPGRITTAAPSTMEETCAVSCGCAGRARGRVGPWGSWGPCRRGARARTRQWIAPPAPAPACQHPTKFVTIEWANCTGDQDDLELVALEPKEDRNLHREIYHDGYIEGSNSMLAVVWTATIILSFYGAFMLYRGFLRCLRSRRMKSITKV